MSALTPTQREVLLAAAQHAERQVIPPERLRGGAVQVVTDALLARGLIEEVGGAPPGFRITEAGAQAARFENPAGVLVPPPNSPSKQSTVVELLRQPQGASIEEITTATGWQKHTVRGLISGAVKKKLGLTVISERIEGVRRYRIGGDQ